MRDALKSKMRAPSPPVPHDPADRQPFGSIRPGLLVSLAAWTAGTAAALAAYSTIVLHGL